MSPVPDKPRYLTEHLQELRRGVVRSLFIAVAGVALALCFSGRLFALLLYPFQSTLAHFPQLAGQVHTLQTLTPMEIFMINMKLALVAGLILASPFVLREVWTFAAPALKGGEKKPILGVFVLGLFFFAAGLAFGYTIIIPLALRFLIQYNLSYQFIPQWTLQGYFGFVVNFLLVFGFIFELPLVLAALTAVGIATPAFLSHKRKHAIVLIFVLAAIIAPSADPVTQTLVAVPLVVLYEVGILFSRLVVRQKPVLPTDVPPQVPKPTGTSKPGAPRTLR